MDNKFKQFYDHRSIKNNWSDRVLCAYHIASFDDANIFKKKQTLKYFFKSTILEKNSKKTIFDDHFRITFWWKKILGTF